MAWYSFVESGMWVICERTITRNTNCVLEAEFAFLDIVCLHWRHFHFELFRFLVSAADRCIRVEDVGNAEITMPMRRDWMKMR